MPKQRWRLVERIVRRLVGFDACCWCGRSLGRWRRRVPGVDVTTQVDSTLERGRASDARERPQTGVFASVRDEVRRLTERLAALTTHVRLLALQQRHDRHT